jgi:hypothetical protein
MVDLEYDKIKTGLFSGKSVGYESKLIRPTATGEVRSLTMYDYETQKRMGAMEYEVDGSQVKVNGFTFSDWKDMKYPEGFVKFFLKKMKKRGITKVIVELYDTGNTTHDKLTVFKNMKFRTDNTGNMTGYQSWLLIRDL